MKRRQFLAIAAAAALPACGGISHEVEIPLPDVRRTDLRFGYYLSVPGQMEATAGHTNVFWHAQFYDSQTLAHEIEDTTHEVVLDCAPQVMPGRRLASDAAESLRAYFLELRELGVLPRVKYLTPMDEPNLFAHSGAEVQAAMDAMRTVAGEFPELVGVRYICIYGEKVKNLWCFEQFDIVGIDNYSQRSAILTQGVHAELMQRLLPHQQVLVLPGAAYGQDPAAFVAYAHSEPRCWGVVPFIWAHVPASADKEGWTGLSRQSLEAQKVYHSAGLVTLNRG